MTLLRPPEGLLTKGEKPGGEGVMVAPLARWHPKAFVSLIPLDTPVGSCP